MTYFVIDGETCETPRNEKGQLDVKNGQVYDLGGQVIADDGTILHEMNVVNRDVFFGMPESMKEAYYADKIPQYLEDIKTKKRQVVNSWQMWNMVYEICKKYNVDAIVAHNARFDVNTLNATMRYQTKSRRRYFLPYGIPIIDTMKLANQTIAKSQDYIDFCQENNYMTNHPIPRPRVTAEILWRYLTNNKDFQEEHTGLADVKIEAQILLECLRRGAEPLPHLKDTELK